MDPAFWQKVVRAVAGTRSDEIGCEECFDELDRFVELVESGKPVEEIMPLVHDHLQRCGDCQEEFEALRAALRAVNNE
jgi:hypothetical protein